METTEPPPSDWSNPSQFLAEIKGLRDYLGIFISNESKGLRDYLRVFISKIFISNVFSSKNIILTDIICFCFKEVQKIIDICDLPNAMSSPLFGVFICEFENLTKKVIDDLKSKTENYAKEIDFKSLHDILTNLSNSLKKNIYLIYETECIKSNEGSISSNSLVSTKSYIKIGEVLKNSSKAIQIKQKLAELRSNGDGETSYYASIVGPSFLGKTQTAFTLSHHMTVFYVNLLSTLNTEDVTMQPIYKETSVFSRLFFETIEADMETVEKKGCDINAHDLLHFKLGFETLGLLYALIHDEKLNLNLTVEEKFMRWCSLGLVVVPKLTVPDFKKKLQDLEINLDDFLIFIDEMPLSDNDEDRIIPRIKFLRNLIRATNMISLLCGTNSHANNLIGKRGTNFSGKCNGMKRWVKVLTELIRANMQSLCCVIEFTSNDGKTKKFVSDFVLRNRGNLTFNYNSLFTEIFGKNFHRISHIKDAEKLLQFIFKYANTSLPGIASAATKFIFDLLISANSNKNSLKNIWIKLNNHIINTVETRKPNIISHAGLTASAHILTFPSKYKSLNELGQEAANKVNEHFFYYGTSGEQSFDLYVGPDMDKGKMKKKIDSNAAENGAKAALSTELYKDNNLFVEKCHFPAVFEDSLLCLSLWNLWHSYSIETRPTLGLLYENYLRTCFNYLVHSNQSVPDSFSFELLAQWAIAYASHISCSGNSESFEVLKEFIVNVQNSEEEAIIKKMIDCLDDLVLPNYLKDFLSHVKIPYLVNGPPKKTLNLKGNDLENVTKNPNMKRSVSKKADKIESKKIAELSNELSSFIKFGTCHRPLNSAGWDVLFDMQVDGADEIGYIECKLWSAPIGLPLIYPYYKKACLNNIKFSIVVAKNIQKGLVSKFLEAKKNVQKPPPKKTTNTKNPGGVKKPPAKKTKLETVGVSAEPPTPNESKDYVDEIEKLVTSATSKSRLNIYCIRPERLNPESDDSIGLTGKIDVEIIKEFSNPTGVFLLIESNFGPTDRTSKS